MENTLNSEVTPVRSAAKRPRLGCGFIDRQSQEIALTPGFVLPHCEELKHKPIQIPRNLFKPLQDIRNIPKPKITRTKTEAVDWDKCFICQKNYYKKNKRTSLVSSERAESIRLAIAKRNDFDLLRRITGENLSACGARYHRECISNYVSKSNFQQAVFATKLDIIDPPLDKLLVYLEGPIECGSAFYVSQLTRMYNDMTTDQLRNDQLQAKLSKHYGSAIRVISQVGQGKSNIIISSKVTLECAIRAALDLAEGFQETQTVETDTEDGDKGIRALNKVARDIRLEIKEILQNKKRTKEEPLLYPSANDISNVSESNKKVSPTLLRLLHLIIDEKAFNTSSESESPAVKIRASALADSITYCAGEDKYVTDFNLGLALHLHHVYGKRELIDTMNLYGLSITYQELRTFLTSAASNILDKNEECFVPSEMIPIHDGGMLIQEGIDNVDLNTETINGKDSFHSLARVMFQTQPNDYKAKETHIVRQSNRTLPMENIDASLTSTQICPARIQRSQPPKRQDAIGQLKALGTEVSKQTP